MKTKEHATLLREQGLSYAEVAEQTGYSIDWCKKNLKTVQKNKQEKGAIAEAVVKAQSKDGITNGEIKYLVRSVYPVDGSKEQKLLEDKAISRFKTAINKEPYTVIRPYWMQPENAQISFNLLLRSIDDISQRMTDEVTSIRQALNLDMTYDNSLRYAIIKMLQGSTLAQEGLESHCDLLARTADNLERRNNDPQHFYAPISTCTEKCALNKPSGKKCIPDECHGAEPDCYDVQDVDMNDWWDRTDMDIDQLAGDWEAERMRNDKEIGAK